LCWLVSPSANHPSLLIPSQQALKEGSLLPDRSGDLMVGRVQRIALSK
jgi:hypothetical protein